MIKLKLFSKCTWIFFFLFLFIESYSQVKTHYFVNPGIKIGYVIGNGGGFIFGTEFSFVMIKKEINSNSHHYGFVIDYDYSRDFSRLHFGVEYSYLLLGMDVGPTFGWNNAKKFVGLSVIPFTGIFLFPYYNYTYFTDGITMRDVGTYFKLPLQLDGKRYIWYKRD